MKANSEMFWWNNPQHRSEISTAELYFAWLNGYQKIGLSVVQQGFDERTLQIHIFVLGQKKLQYPDFASILQVLYRLK